MNRLEGCTIAEDLNAADAVTKAIAENRGARVPFE
jgi:hypothetical protein